MIHGPFPCYDPAMRLSFIVALSLAAPLFAQTDAPQEILRQRQEIITAILTTDRPDLVERHRWLCINGQEPSSVREARSGGMDFTPDAADSCVAILQREGKEQRLLDAYRTLTAKLGGDASTFQTLPKAIGAAVLAGKQQVSIGNDKGTTISPELAFDAGFTVAYMDNASRKTADPHKLKAVAERCLDGSTDAGTCFSVGYVYGSQAIIAP